MDGVAACVGIPILAFCDRIPLLARVVEIYGGKHAAIIERTFANGRDAARNRDAYKRAKLLKACQSFYNSIRTL